MKSLLPAMGFAVVCTVGLFALGAALEPRSSAPAPTGGFAGAPSSAMPQTASAQPPSGAWPPPPSANGFAAPTQTPQGTPAPVPGDSFAAAPSPYAAPSGTPAPAPGGTLAPQPGTMAPPPPSQAFGAPGNGFAQPGNGFGAAPSPGFGAAPSPGFGPAPGVTTPPSGFGSGAAAPGPAAPAAPGAPAPGSAAFGGEANLFAPAPGAAAPPTAPPEAGWGPPAAPLVDPRRFTEAHWQGIEVVPNTAALARALNIDPSIRGVIVDDVTLPADLQGFQAGDVITRVDGQPTPDLLSFIQASDRAREAPRATLDVVRGGRLGQLPLTALLGRMGTANGETPSMIPANARMPHAYRGPCVDCHRIGTTGTLRVDQGDPMPNAGAVPVIRAGARRPHVDRGPCVTCHTIVP